MKMVKQSVTPSGSAGSASGTAAFDNYHDGKLYALYLDYATGLASTTDVSLKLYDPTVAVFTRSNSIVDGWFFPRIKPSGSTSGVMTETTDPNAAMLPLVDPPYLVVSQSTQVDDAVTCYLFIEES
jgi:hypothetical protein